MFKVFFKKKAKLAINTTPAASVYVDNQNVGVTPYEGVFGSGEHLIGLVSQSEPFRFETKIELALGVRTVINRTLADLSEKQSGEIITFEKTGEKGSSVSIVTEPDAVLLTLNGQAKGYSPLKIDNLFGGEQSLVLESPGFEKKEIKLNAVNGYKIVLIAKLGVDPSTQTISEMGKLAKLSWSQWLA